MKRRILVLLASLALTAAWADKLTIKNTLGSDFDELGDSDIFTHSNTDDISGETVTENAFAIGEQFQADFESSSLDARFRLEVLYDGSDSADASLIVAPTGFVHYEPIPQFGIIAGNNFYKRFAVDSAYLAAADDTTKYGRLITDSLGEDRYFGSDNFAIYTNGFAGGLSSNWDWTLSNGLDIYAKAAAGATMYPDEDEFEKAVDFGVNGGINNVFDIAFTAHDILEDDRKFGVFAGYTGKRDFVLNVGFYYNFTDSDYLPEACVERNDIYEYKKQSTKYALGASCGYLFSNGFGIYADLISGLTNEYIGKIKYYDSEGNLIDTKITTIVRGETVVKYKNGTAKRTDEFPARTIPLYSQLRLTYMVSQSFDAAVNIKMRTWIYDTEESEPWITIYPRCSFKLPHKYGKIGAGIRLDMNYARHEGISSISFPVTYTHKFKNKF